MHTPLSVHTSICVRVCVFACWLQCVNTSSTLHSNPLIVGKTVLHLRCFPPFPITHTHKHTLYAQYAHIPLGLDTRSHRHIGYISPWGVSASLGAPMSAGMVVGATGQVRSDWRVCLAFSMTITGLTGLFQTSVFVILLSCHVNCTATELFSSLDICNA